MMRRKDKHINDDTRLESVFQNGTVCHLALHDETAPYVIPLSYGYEDGVLYFHGAAEGKKLDLIRLNPQAGFCISRELKLETGDSACDWGVKYESVQGIGTVKLLEDNKAKRHALDMLMKHYGWEGRPEYSPGSFTATTAFALYIREFTGKGSKI